MAAAPDGRWTSGKETWVVDFPVLWVAVDWEERHGVISDPVRGVHRDEWGDPEPFVEYPQQLWVTVNWYRIRPTAKLGDLNLAFHYRRVQYVGPQKCGKGPWLAKKTKGQASGPVLFAGWAEGGEVYACEDHGCPCGWEYTYKHGEPMGKPWAKPLMQLMATSEDQVDNVYDPLKAMLKYGHDANLFTVGEEFSRLPNDGKIETVTSSALSRLGNPIIFAGQDETGLYTDTNKLRKPAETQRRGAAAMGGRSIETTNPWDPGEDSVAQRTWESKRPDIFRFWLNPELEVTLRRPDGKPYSFWVKRERRKILAHVYQGINHVTAESVEAEALEIGEKDPGQAVRFYGNKAESGHGVWMVPERWNLRAKPRGLVAPKTQIVAGFDGSDVDDWTGFRCETRDGYQFTPTFPDGRPMIWNPADFPGHQVPRIEVSAGMAHIAATFQLVRMYADPPYWESECDTWAELYGEDIVIRWYTKRATQMHSAAERLHVDLGKVDSGFWHDGCEFTAAHVHATHKTPRPSADQPGRYVLCKPGDGRKIDMAIPSILAHEAHGDVTSTSGWPATENYAYFI
ncbi:hypothetical protein [Jatrophihabitans sp.]|uniref:hypothetical protein n=1 Tax=Jatrophihabitans sp. TaxID=1932789 RepID=UPI0030C6F484|nr:hypothetical protein [Jatrophihabitans sp.]